MTPYTKKFRTYSRSKNSISGVTAFNLLLAKNLTQKKLSTIKKNTKHRRKNDRKQEFKELPQLIKSVVSDESLHVNLDDTFDRLCKRPVLKKPVYVSMDPGNVSDLSDVSEVSGQVQKLRSFKGKSILKVSTYDTSCSWFMQQTPTGEAITNSLEIETKNTSKTANQSSIVLRSHSFLSQSLPKSTPIKVNKKPNCSVAVDSTTNEIYCNSPFFGNQLPISPIIPKEKSQLEECIVESLREIKSWSCVSQSLCDTNKTNERSKKCETSKDDCIVSPLQEFELFESKFYSTLNPEVSSFLDSDDKQFNGNVNDRKNKLTTNVQKKMLKDFLVVLDKSQIHSKDRLTLPMQPDYIFGNRDMTRPRTKKLTVNITQCSLSRFKKQQQRLSKRVSHFTPIRNSKRLSKHKSDSGEPGFSQKEYLCKILKVTSDTESPQKSSLDYKTQSETSNRLSTFTIDLTGDSDNENKLPRETTSLELPKTKQIATRNSSRTSHFDITKKEYLCKLINVSSDDDDSLLQLKNKSMCKSLSPPGKLVTDEVDCNDKIIDLVSSDEETDVILSSSTGKIGQRKQSSFPSVTENTAVQPSRISSDHRDSEIFVKPSGKLWRRSLQKKQRLESDKTNPEASKIFRLSTIIVPAPESNKYKRKTVLLNYAETSLPLSDITNRLSKIPPRKSGKFLSGRELVLKYCSQSQPEPFHKIFSEELLGKCRKIAEGTYGEVFMYTDQESSTVMKVIPIEGDLIVNGEKQKKFDEILSEVVIVSKLSNLRIGTTNKTSNFCQVQRISCVQGRYPDTLIQRWHEYKAMKGTENDPPDNFDNKQLYIILELFNAGQDLEKFVFTNAQQAVSVFKQVAYTLAVAEAELKFEHRDLHWGNILVKKVDPSEEVTFTIRGQTSICKSYGVQATLIDFTLSRIESEGVIMFLNLGEDPYLFKSFGDYQFEIYRLMQQRNGNDWKAFIPYTNLLWLHYYLDKSLTALRYKNSKTKIHAKHLDILKHYKELVLNYDSVSQFVEKCSL